MTTMSGMPAYLQVAADLRSQIERGDLSPGAQLPSSTRLQEIYSVSNTVIRDAVKELRRAGLVVGQQGKGVFVQEPGGAATDNGTPLADLERRLEALEREANASAETDVSAEIKSLRREIANLQTYIIDLYTRIGAPYPREMGEEATGEEAPSKSMRPSRSA